MLLLSRELRRVPLDFDAPVGETWAPFIDLPPELVFPPCPACEPASRELGTGTADLGDGLTSEARAIDETLYALRVDVPYRRHVSALSNLGEREVELLAQRGQFKEAVPCPNGCEKGSAREDCECQDGTVIRQLRPTAAEVNAVNRDLDDVLRTHPLHLRDPFGRDAVLRVRCELLGIELDCPTCEGHGDIATEQEREAREAWRPPDPPEGPGYQLWQTVSEGGPVSPVFETPEELAAWLAEHHEVAGNRYTPEGWLRVMRGEASGIDISPMGGALI